MFPISRLVFQVNDVTPWVKELLNVAHTIFVLYPIHMDCIKPKVFGIFSVCAPPPSLVGAYYLHPPDALAIFLHIVLLCNDTCSVTGGA